MKKLLALTLSFLLLMIMLAGCGMASMVSSPRARITDNMMMLLRFIV